ncbi:MAG: glycoside hydrolase family 13 protein [Oscillospiraceae bacterium]|nr:glycoside hydrolase family 13 protein [Oscillospiraceae bacterium]
MYIFDENDIYFRNPGGAIEVSGDLTLQLKLKRGEASNPRVCVYPDGGETEEIPLNYVEAVGNFDVFSITLGFETAALYWYNFLIDTADRGQIAIPEHVGGGYQITAYNPENAKPDWIQGGMIYHIFVDRFRSDGKLRPRQGAIQRQDWGGCPYFLPDEKGIVRNNDFFGGDLYGIIEKLDYLEDLGVTCIYLSPVFEADSNHKYDTGNYMKVDAAFGGDEALEELCKKAGEHGIKVILDGVFNHVGSDSVYFNKLGNYDSVGAYKNRNSPYYDWFYWINDEKYESWWGIELLPTLNKQSESYKEFLCGKDGVLAHWMRRGVSGWRLDVVDEIPDILLDPMCQAMRRENENVFIAGEVWEDASHKIAYSVRRRYFLGGQLTSVTNYPLKNAIIAFAKDGDAYALADTVAALCRNYPKYVLDSLMSIIGTHDTMRILTVLGGADFPEGKLAMSHFRLTESQLELAKKRLRLASSLQFTLPGVPCVYYGDEVGMEGCIDPFNRRCYPWGEEDTELLEWYKKLSEIRKQNSAFKDGEYKLIEARDGFFAFTRGEGTERVLVAVNTSDSDRQVNIEGFYTDLMSGSKIHTPTIKPKEVGFYKC